MTLHKILPWAAVIISIAGAAYVTFYFSTAEAIYSRAVGDFSLKFVPNEGDGTEYVELSFTGVLSRESIANLSGWTLSNGTGHEESLSNFVLSNTKSIRICEVEAEAKQDPSCEYFFTSSNIFDNASGTIMVKEKSGVPVLTGSYDKAGVGEVISVSGGLNYFEDVYTNGDKVTICAMQKDGSLKLRKEGVSRLTRDIAGAIAAGEDIVPPFVYEDGKTTLGYHPGVNWPAGKGILERGCQ